MVHVTVRVNHGNHRSFAQVFIGECQTGSCGFGAGQWIDDNPAGITPDQGHVGDIKSSDLVDPIYHLEQAMVLRVQLRLPPHGWVYGVGCFSVEEAVNRLKLKGRSAGAIVRDTHRRNTGDKAPLSVLETAPV